MSDLSAIKAALREEEREVQRLTGEAQVLAREGKAFQQEVITLLTNSEALEEAIGVLNSFADTKQADLQRKIEGIVTYGLHAVFEENLSFHIVSSVKGKLAAADFLIRSTTGDEVVDTPVMEARGGGIAAVAGFLLRLVLLLLRGSRPVLFLDESFAQLSAEYEPKLAEFLRELVDRTDAQIVLVTHSDAYSDVADNVYRFTLKDGRTVVTAG